MQDCRPKTTCFTAVSDSFSPWNPSLPLITLWRTSEGLKGAFFFWFWLFSCSCGQYTLVLTNIHFITFFVDTCCKEILVSGEQGGLHYNYYFLLCSTLCVFYHNRTLMLSLLPLDLFSHQSTALSRSFFVKLSFPSCRGREFRPEVLLSPAAANESTLVGQDGCFGVCGLNFASLLPLEHLTEPT